MKVFKEILSYVLIIIAVLLFRTFIMSFAIVDGQSMMNTLQNNNFVVVSKVNYIFGDIKRFDVVVAEVYDEVDHKKRRIVKRVIGLPGETVKYENNKLYINGVLTNEDYLREGTVTGDFSTNDFSSYVIPDNSYLILGDNRGNSTDSRMLGYISGDKIIGKVTFRLYPFNKIGIIR